MARCLRCGGPFPEEAWDAAPPHNPRKWCSQVCRQLAYIDRKKEKAMSDPEQPELVIEAYGTVTPPPEPDPDEEKNS